MRGDDSFLNYNMQPRIKLLKGLFTMKTLYLDCGMGAAGDMLAGALYDLLSEEQRAEFRNIAAAFSAVGLNVRCAAAEKCGIRGIHFAVDT